MSETMIAFIRSENIPSINQLRNRLSEEGLELESWDDEGLENLEDVEGFWPGKLKGDDAGFEFGLNEVDDEDLESWEIDKTKLEGRDLVVELSFYEELDVAAAILCLAVLCYECDGLTFDNDEELTINADNCMKWGREQADNIMQG